MRRGHELAGARREAHPLVHAVEHGDGEPGEESHALGERLPEVGIAAHGARGDAGDALADARLIAQQVDDLLVEERGVDIHDDEPRVHAGSLLCVDDPVSIALATVPRYCLAKKASAMAPGPTWVPIVAPTVPTSSWSRATSCSHRARESSMYFWSRWSERPV